jgi:hypothetical protein
MLFQTGQLVPLYARVAQHGPRKWTLIATRLKTKTQKQVYARWRDYLQPGLTTKPWSKVRGCVCTSCEFSYNP